MIKLQVTAMRSPSLHQYGPEEDKVVGVFDSVQNTYNLFRVDGEHIGSYDIKNDCWEIFDGPAKGRWSDLFVEVIKS